MHAPRRRILHIIEQWPSADVLLGAYRRMASAPLVAFNQRCEEAGLSMSLPNAYLTSFRNTAAILKAIQAAQAPPRFMSGGPRRRREAGESRIHEPGMTFAAFDPPGLAHWLVGARANYVKERMAAGDSKEEAEANASASFERLLPDGSPAPGQLIGRVLSGGQSIGFLWIGPAGTDPKRWWVWDIVIDEAQRGRGYGRQAMLLAEQLARAAGATTIGLNVFAHNVVARSLCASLGYEESSVQMRKTL